MSQKFNLSLTTRNDLGKGASRRLRRIENKVPGIVYGTETTPVPVSALANELSKLLESEAFYSSIINLNLNGEDKQAVLKDLQRHPAKGHAIHADFQLIDATHKIHMNVPVHFINEDICVGVKMHGGSIAHQLAEVEISCLAKDLPEYLEIDLKDINTGTTLHLSDITLPAGVEIIELSHGESHDHPVVNVIAPRGEEASEDDNEATAAE